MHFSCKNPAFLDMVPIFEAPSVVINFELRSNNSNLPLILLAREIPSVASSLTSPKERFSIFPSIWTAELILQNDIDYLDAQSSQVTVTHLFLSLSFMYDLMAVSTYSTCFHIKCVERLALKAFLNRVLKALLVSRAFIEIKFWQTNLDTVKERLSEFNASLLKSFIYF